MSPPRSPVPDQGAAAVRFHCPACGPQPSHSTFCARCAGHVDLPPLPGIDRARIVSTDRSLWRYRRALPTAIDNPLSLGEGMTPLVAADLAGFRPWFKLEFLNPTGSFKDRGSAVLLSFLGALGIRRVVEDSSGNAGASMASYAARAGIGCRIVVPADTPRAKLVQVRAAGAEITLVAGDRSQAEQRAREVAEGECYAGHNWHPMFLQGTKTIGYEIWEQLGFRVPDNIVMPMGGGSNLLGCQLAFSELARAGEVTVSPRLFGIQAAACCPLHRALQGAETGHAEDRRMSTMAAGIALPRPVRGAEVVAAIRASGGTSVAVDEAAIGDALIRLAGLGFFVEPTSAVALAGLDELIARGLVEPGQTTVVILTGSGLKDIASWAALLDARAPAAGT